MNITGLHHIGIYTVDIDRSQHFYNDLLKFTTTWAGDLPLPPGIFKVAMLRMGSCVVELVQPPDSSRVASNHGPVQHIALEVSDLEEVVSELKGKNAVFETGNITTMPDFCLHGVRNIFITGPSGERIELVENIQPNRS